MARSGFHFFTPPDYIICMFIEQCLESVRTSSTIKNYISALSSCYLQMGLNPAPFHSFKVRNAMLSVDKNVRHVATPSLPVTPRILRKVVQVVTRMPEGPSLAAALILMYHTFLRGSNFAAESSALFDATRQLTRDDVAVYRTHLTINHKWSKSHQSSSHRAVVKMPAIPGSRLCPRAAFIAMVQAVPTRYPAQPLLMFRDGNHIPLYYIRKVRNSVMTSINVPHHSRYTLHGLRRGAATQSKAVDAYLPNTTSKVFKAILTVN